MFAFTQTFVGILLIVLLINDCSKRFSRYGGMMRLINGGQRLIIITAFVCQTSYQARNIN